MENSTSATSHSSSSGVNTTKNNKKKNNNNPIISANDDIGSSICFGSFSLSSKNATTSAAAVVFPSSSDSSEKLQETQVMKEGRKGSSPEFDDSRVTKEFILGGIEWPSPSSSSVHPHYQNIWEGQNSYNGGNACHRLSKRLVFSLPSCVFSPGK